MGGDGVKHGGGNFKRNSWKSRSFSCHRPKTIVEENEMRPNRAGLPKRGSPRRRMLSSLRKRCHSLEEEEEEQRCGPLRGSKSYTTLTESNGHVITNGVRGKKGVARSSSYVIQASEDNDCSSTSDMTTTSPLIIDVGDMKVECVVGEKPGTATLATQTEQVPAGLSAETSLELLKKLNLPALRRELERKKVRFSKNDGKDQLQAKLEAVLKMEVCPPTCPITRGKIIIHSEPAEIKKKAQQIAVMAHNTDTPQILGEATKQLNNVTQEVRVIRQLLEAHVQHIKAVSDHSTVECGCNMMLENMCHSLSHYHVRKLESQLQETLSELNMLQLEKHSLLRAVSRLCAKRSPSASSTRSLAHFMSSGGSQTTQTGAACAPCVHGDCRIEYLTSLMESVLQHHQ